MKGVLVSWQNGKVQTELRALVPLKYRAVQRCGRMCSGSTVKCRPEGACVLTVKSSAGDMEAFVSLSTEHFVRSSFMVCYRGLLIVSDVSPRCNSEGDVSHNSVGLII